MLKRRQTHATALSDLSSSSGEKGPHKQLVAQPLKVVDHDDRNIDVDLRVPKVAKREKER